MERTTLAIAFSTIFGVTAIGPASAVGLADGYYDMVINNTPYINGIGYVFGSDGAWNSSFSFGSLPGSKGSSSYALYDDTIAAPVNGKYSGTINDGVAGTIGIQVTGGIITGTGKFEFDTVYGTPFGSFAEYGGSSSFTGSIDASGNIILTPTGVLGTGSDFPNTVGNRWNVDDYAVGTGSGTNFVLNPPNGNTLYDAFSTGTATNLAGTITGAAYDGTRAILVKGGQIGSDYGCCFGANYNEVWNVSFIPTASPVPIPATAWLLGSGLIGLARAALRKRPPQV